MNFMAHRSSRTLSELIKMGFDKKKLDNIGSFEGKADLELTPNIWQGLKMLEQICSMLEKIIKTK